MILHYLYLALASPKAMSNTIKNFQRNFLWGGVEKNKKWALVAWEKMCRPKKYGGLGIRDTHLLRKALEAKNLWRWIENQNSTWRILWKSSYAPTHSQEKIISLNGSTKFSLIWNRAWEHHAWGKSSLLGR